MATVTGTYRVRDVAGLLENETSRCILVAAYGESKSVTALTDRCDSSKPTVYRRLEELEECDFVLEETKLEPDGNHHPIYRTNVRTVTFAVTGDGVEFTVDLDEPMADRFTRIVERI